MKENPIYKSELDKVFRYDAETNILERILKGGSWRVVTLKQRSDGYSHVKFNGRMITLHRLIYTLVHGNIPENLHVDHIDDDKSNNNISNLQLLNNQDNRAKSSKGINPYIDKIRGTYRVQAKVWYGEKQHRFQFKEFKILSEAQLFCDAYNAKFSYGMSDYSARTGTPEDWRICMKAFEYSYFNPTKLIQIDHTEIITRICLADNDEITDKLIPEISNTPYTFIQREDLLCEIHIRLEENGRLIPKGDLRVLLRYKGDPLLEAGYCPGLEESRELLATTNQYYNKYCISSFHFFIDLFEAHPEIRINTGGKSKIMKKMNFKLWGPISLDGVNRTIYTTDTYNRDEVRQLMS